MRRSGPIRCHSRSIERLVRWMAGSWSGAAQADLLGEDADRPALEPPLAVGEHEGRAGRRGEGLAAVGGADERGGAPALDLGLLDGERDVGVTRAARNCRNNGARSRPPTTRSAFCCGVVLGSTSARSEACIEATTAASSASSPSPPSSPSSSPPSPSSPGTGADSLGTSLGGTSSDGWRCWMPGRSALDADADDVDSDGLDDASPGSSPPQPAAPTTRTARSRGVSRERVTVPIVSRGRWPSPTGT